MKNKVRVARHARMHTHALRMAALAYIKLGWSVVPLHSAHEGVCSCSEGAKCKSPGKHPRTAHGVNDATLDAATILRWWSSDVFPDANIGIATGSRSGLVVIDIDPRNGGQAKKEELVEKGGKLPKTLKVCTGGGGWHHYFSRAGSSRTQHLGGIDVMADGGFVVAPPSIHASGTAYKWVDGRDPKSMKAVRLPSFWAEVGSTKLPSTGFAAQGSRNNEMTRLGGVLRSRGLDETRILEGLLAENRERCKPPLADEEVAKIARSVAAYPAPTGAGDHAEEIAQLVLTADFAGGAHLLFARDGRFWRFDGTRWIPVRRETLGGIILNQMRANPAKRGATAPLVAQVTTVLTALTSTDEDVLRFEAPQAPVINCRNGELWLTGDGVFDFRPHEATSYLRNCLDIDYDPNARCPNYDKAVLDIFSRDKDLASLWNELVGYALQPARPTAMIVVCRGGGSNGKTALVDTMVKLLGKDHVVAMPVEDIDKSRFALASFLGKLLFVDDDVKAGARLPDGQLKRLSEAKLLTAEHKYGAPFNFMATALPVLLCNNPPSVADLSYGMQRRLIVIPFDRTFRDAEIDRGLFPTIHREELSGVLNRALIGLQAFVRRGWKFDTPEAVGTATRQWLVDANPLPAFLESCCDRNGKVWLDELYQAFENWCSASGITRPQQKGSLKRNLASLGFEIVHGNRGDRVVGLSLTVPASHHY